MMREVASSNQKTLSSNGNEPQGPHTSYVCTTPALPPASILIIQVLEKLTTYNSQLQNSCYCSFCK